MKKTRFLIILLLFATTLFIESSVNANQIDVEMPEIPGEVFTTFTCRCKHGGCYGGNNLSIRAACAKNVDDCTKYAHNCP